MTKNQKRLLEMVRDAGPEGLNVDAVFDPDDRVQLTRIIREKGWLCRHSWVSLVMSGSCYKLTNKGKEALEAAHFPKLTPTQGAALHHMCRHIRAQGCALYWRCDETYRYSTAHALVRKGVFTNGPGDGTFTLTDLGAEMGVHNGWLTAEDWERAKKALAERRRG